ncbi:mechanosensitive ion channel family protein [Galbibacter mesophilus]|uniref:mechanosensitive ion channel family protein n=1 Tax=Galbibacter mesophilus TaxID=379069 RepID=UPI00191E62EB|nr:mechanosensitive ion channel family protein [Galbibacter mesophilus]MCM5663400.1 mechanosensitive ion channel family protein [Galbibacter mesophilus]
MQFLLLIQELDVYENVKTSTVEYWTNFLEALPLYALGILILVLGVLIATWIGQFSKARIQKRTQDPLMSKFLGNAIRFILIIIFILLALDAAGLGNVSAGILAAAGASAVVLGFAFKDVGQNFIAGIILSFNRPFNVNDTVEIGDIFGKVKTLEFRYTKLKTFDGKDVYIPNSDVITHPVTNYTEDGFFRYDFVIGIAYEDNIDGAKKVVLQALSEEPDVITDAEHVNFVTEDKLDTSTVNLKVFFWVDTKEFGMNALLTKGNVVRRVKEALEDAGYYMPADIHEIKLYGKETELPVTFIDKKQEKSAEN